MRTKTTQISVITVAALAIVALLAVFWAVSGAQAENVTTNTLPYESGNGHPPQQTTPEPPPEPTPQAQPEACAANPAHAITSGRFALFDVYWDSETQTLNNNPCPPAVDHIVEIRQTRRGPIPVVVGTSRQASKINIDSTIIHMPTDFRLRVVEAKGPMDGQDGTYAVPKGSRLLEAYPASDTDKFVWLLPEWEPETPDPDEEELFHIGFSAALLRPADWEGDIRWNFETLREPDVAPEDRGVVLVTGDPTFRRIDWDSGDPDTQLVTVSPGEYEHRSWAFTKPGTYVLRVHARGKPATGHSLGTRDKSVSSDISHYTFHVGSLADLSVAVSADNAAPEAGGVVTYTVQAANAGPDTAPHGEVTLSLPEGLTYDPVDTLVNGAAPADNAVSISDDGHTLSWQVGEMANDFSATLSFKARVGGDTRGQSLDVTANIVARETIGSSEVLQLDPRDGDNRSTFTIISIGTVNRAPLFNLQWSVREDATAAAPGIPGALVGRIKAVDPEGDTLFYNLTGEGKENFDPMATDDGVEIRLSAQARLDYEVGPRSYNLLLGVTDAKSETGGVDATTDDTIGIMIAVTNVVDANSDLAFSVDPAELAIGETATFTLDIMGELPDGASNVTVHITGPVPTESYTATNVTSFPVTWALVGSGDPGSREYNASLRMNVPDKSRVHFSAGPVTVNWTAATGSGNGN